MLGRGSVNSHRPLVLPARWPPYEMNDLLIYFNRYFLLLSFWYCYYSHKTGVAHKFILMASTLGASSSHTISFFLASPLKPLNQIKPNLAGMVPGWVPFKVVSDSSVLHSSWLLLLKIKISSIVHCCFIIPSPTKLRWDIVMLPSVRPSMDFDQTWYILSP
jgi:hypothetical protein